MTQTPSAEFRTRLQMARAKFLPVMPLTELAQRVGRPYHTVKYWQYTGNIPIDALGELCDALGVEMDYWRLTQSTPPTAPANHRTQGGSQ